MLTHTGDLSAQLATIGVPALNAPSRLGGLALGLTADIVVNDRLGYALQPLGCYRETAFALDLLDGAQVSDLSETVAALISGSRHAVLIGLGASGVRVKADGTVWGEGGTVWGTSEPLPRSDVGLCLVHGTGDDGTSAWHLVVPDPATCTVESFDHFGTPATRIRFDGATASPLPLTAAHWDRALAAAHLRQAALLLGIADRILEVARSHVNTRIQSGRPLVERQTVAHRLAVLMGEADGWRLVLHQAAWDHDRGESASTAAVLAAIAEHAQVASRTALQLHGVRGMLAHSTTVTAYRQVSVESAAASAAPRRCGGKPSPPPGRRRSCLPGVGAGEIAACQGRTVVLFLVHGEGRGDQARGAGRGGERGAGRRARWADHRHPRRAHGAVQERALRALQVQGVPAAAGAPARPGAVRGPGGPAGVGGTAR